MDLINRVEKTIVIGICWLTFIIIFLGFNPARLDIWQNMAAVLASGVIAIGTIALICIRRIYV